MIDLDETYKRLARPWTPNELAKQYKAAERGGERLVQDDDEVVNRPITLLATAIPPSASLNVAVHVLHALPRSADSGLADQLLTTVETNAADALHRCHRALELDGRGHDYAADEWLPVVYDSAAPLLKSARLDQEPPSVVRAAQEAVHWLASTVINLEQDSAETPAALAEVMARLLVVSAFARTAEP